MQRKLPNYEEFTAAQRRRRALHDTAAALAADEATAAAAASLGGAAEDAFLASAQAHAAMLVVIAVQLCCLMYELCYLRMASTVGAFAALPGHSGLALLLAQALPPTMRLVRTGFGYLVIGLWLVSFAELALFLQGAWVARGKRGVAGVAAAVMERPLRACDAVAVLLSGSALLFGMGPRA